MWMFNLLIFGGKYVVVFLVVVGVKVVVMVNSYWVGDEVFEIIL